MSNSKVLGTNTAVEQSSSKEEGMIIPLVCRITLPTGEVNEVRLTLKSTKTEKTNLSTTVSYLTTIDYLRSQLSPDEKVAYDKGEFSLADKFNDKAHVLSSILNSDNTVEFFNLDGSVRDLFSAGIHSKEWKLGKTDTGLNYLTCTWYTESTKTVLGKVDSTASESAIAFIKAQEQYLLEMNARLKAQTTASNAKPDPKG